MMLGLTMPSVFPPPGVPNTMTLLFSWVLRISVPKLTPSARMVPSRSRFGFFMQPSLHPASPDAVRQPECDRLFRAHAVVSVRRGFDFPIGLSRRLGKQLVQLTDRKSVV